MANGKVGSGGSNPSNGEIAEGRGLLSPSVMNGGWRNEEGDIKEGVF